MFIYHDNGLVAEFLEVVVDVGDADNTRILFVGEILSGMLCFVVIENSSHERRNQVHTSFSTSDSLREGEDQGQIAVDFIFLKCLSSFDTLPSGSNFDQDSVFRNACFLVEFHDSLGLNKVGNAKGTFYERIFEKERERKEGNNQ